MLWRHAKLWFSLARFSLLGELAFRTNFLVKVMVEVLWLGVLLLFNLTLFQQTQAIAGWRENQYLFFVGTYFALAGLLETLFVENCNAFAELIRTGELDFYLLQPVDEQFLISCRKVDWSAAPNVLMGFGVMAAGYVREGAEFDPLKIALFLLLFLCGAGLAYSFLLMLTASSVWLVRNQSLYEMWWLFTTLMRFPREIYQGQWASLVGHLFWFLVPIMLATNVPARLMVQVLEPWLALYLALATLAAFWLSRRFFRLALQRYRSASS